MRHYEGWSIYGNDNFNGWELQVSIESRERRLCVEGQGCDVCGMGLFIVFIEIKDKQGIGCCLV